MTLNITMVAPWGIWQCTDHRLTDGTGKLVTDTSPKHYRLTCSDGTALVAYTGVGRVKGTDVCDWLAMILRGENRTLAESLNIIRKRADVEIIPSGRHLLFSVAALLSGTPWAVVISNVDESHIDWWQYPVKPVFAASPHRVGSKSEAVLLLTGASGAVSREDKEKLRRASWHRPRRPEQYHALLAQVNRRASQNSNLISPSCTSTFLPTDGRAGGSVTHGNTPGTVIVGATTVLGLDFTEQMRLLMESRVRDETGRPMNPREFATRSLDAAIRSVTPPSKGGVGRPGRAPADTVPVPFTIPIPSQTIPAGTATLGPYTVPPGHNCVEVTLDIANLSSRLAMEIGYSEDGGVTWRELGGATYEAPEKARTGPITTGESPCLGAAGSPVRLLLTSANAQVRVTLINKVPFATAGGRVVLY